MFELRRVETESSGGTNFIASVCIPIPTSSAEYMVIFNPFQSAMSMLNRAGTKLLPTQKVILEQAKDELRELFGRKRKH